MNIETKLALVESRQRIVGIKKGMFVRFYEQSLFGWQQWVSKQDQLPTLKVLRKKVKKLGSAAKFCKSISVLIFRYN
ncbi:hypothetical protein [Vibrio rumoiensis]|uniref:hypothetical protein n=1 Tax=Vibrio rumoiensis TaxID=76258 RepID=UPI003AA82EFE